MVHTSLSKILLSLTWKLINQNIILMCNIEPHDNMMNQFQIKDAQLIKVPP